MDIVKFNTKHDQWELEINMLEQRKDEAISKGDYNEAGRLRDQMSKVKYKYDTLLIREGTLVLRNIMK